MTAPSNFSTGTLSVTANNVCGSSAATTKSLSSIPGKPDVITGPTTVTAQQTGLVYSVPAVAGVTYTWTLPGTGTLLTGQGTASITAKWGNTNGNVTVRQRTVAVLL